ncbi:DUF885 family protein, partial [Flavobacterium cupreum]
RSGVVLPTAIIKAALPQHRNLVSATPETSVFYTPVKNLPASFSSEEKRSLGAEYKAEIGGRLNPALAKLARFLEKEYLPVGRDSAGMGAMPNGSNWYLARVASRTTSA